MSSVHRTPAQRPRHNVASACTACRIKKSKCDGKLPCSRCSRLNKECKFEGDKRRDNSLRHQLQQAKLQLRRLEAQTSSQEQGTVTGELEGDQSMEEDGEGEDDDEGGSQTPLANGSNHFNTSTTARPAAAPLNAVASSSTHPQPSWGLVRDQRSGQTLHFGSSSFHAILAEGEDGGTRENQQPLPTTPLRPTSTILTFQTLSASLHLELLDLFFTYINNCLYFVDKEAFMVGVNSGIQSPDYSYFLHLSILALSCHLHPKKSLVRTRPLDPSSAGEGFLTEASGMLYQEIKNPHPTSTIGITILCSCWGDEGQESLSWVHSGVACRLGQHLGLHIEDRSVAGWEAKERNMWAVFAHDKLSSLYTGRSCALQAEDMVISIPPPVTIVRDPPTRMELDEATRTASARLAVIAGHIMRDIYGVRARPGTLSLQVFKELDKSLTSWANTLPNFLQDSMGGIRSQLPQVLFMHTQYLSLRLLLHRPFLRHGATTGEQARNRCWEAAVRMTELTSLYSALYGMSSAIISFTHNIYTAASSLLLLYVDEDSGFDRTILTTALTRSTSALSELSNSWSVAHKALLALHNLASGCLDDGTGAGDASDLLGAIAKAAKIRVISNSRTEPLVVAPAASDSSFYGQSPAPVPEPSFPQPAFHNAMPEDDAGMAAFLFDEIFLMPAISQTWVGDGFTGWQ